MEGAATSVVTPAGRSGCEPGTGSPRRTLENRKGKKSASLEVDIVGLLSTDHLLGKQPFSATYKWNVEAQEGPAYQVHVAGAQCQSPADRCPPAAV